MHLAISPTSLDSWQNYLDREHPDAHVLQCGTWGSLKAEFGWSPLALERSGAGALALVRNFPLGLQLAYIPRGPVGDWVPDLVSSLDNALRDRGVFALVIEPDGALASEERQTLLSRGFRETRQTIQPRRTLVVDLSPDEDEILGRMHQKTRYNIRLAGRKGVTVKPWADVEGFSRMMNTTGARQEFGVHSPEYYRLAYELFHPRGECELLVAEFEGTPLASLMVFARGRRAWYFYGASTEIERNRMPTYALQWAAIQWARSRGCLSYDLWGIPDEDVKTLESQFKHRSDGLWGVYRFKRGFGGEVVPGESAWHRVYRPLQYLLYRAALRVRNRSLT